jgi:hypothetical protein
MFSSVADQLLHFFSSCQLETFPLKQFNKQFLFELFSDE